MNAMKTELSPAAKAVIDAFAKASDGEYIDGEWHQDDIGQLAAALRAVADQLDVESPWPGHIESTGVNWSRNELYKIAAELGAQP